MATTAAAVTMPTYTTWFPFEYQFNHHISVAWMRRNWTLSLYFSIAYVIFIFGAKRIMTARRDRFELKGLLIVWNAGLALFSIAGAFRMIPELVYMLKQPEGFHNSVCVPIHDHNPVWAFWTFVFILSKVPELGDTVFIVLRKQPLILLHWYHHITVLIYSWLSYAEYVAPARWFVTMNFTVHSFMYSYYCLRALGYKLPKFLSVAITSSQILQMAVGVAVNVHAYRTKVRLGGSSCDVSYLNIYLSFAMYLSYFMLFTWFFYMSYIAKTKVLPQQRQRHLQSDFQNNNGRKVK